MKLYRVAFFNKAGKLSATWHGTSTAANRHYRQLEQDPAQRPIDIEAVEIPTNQKASLADWLNTEHTYRAERL